MTCALYKLMTTLIANKALYKRTVYSCVLNDALVEQEVTSNSALIHVVLIQAEHPIV